MNNQKQVNRSVGGEEGSYRPVSDQWNPVRSVELKSDEVGLLLYRSNLLGADRRITNFGGGNTSAKVVENHPLTGDPAEILWIKGSGGDLATLKKNGLAALYQDRLLGLQNIYRGRAYENEMVPLYAHCLYDPNSPAPSIDTPLHALLPFRHIDHLHPDAVIALAAAQDGERLVEELFEGSVGWVGWQRPGFDLALALRACLDRRPGIRGIVLAAHGLFSWGETSYGCYLNSLEIIERCEAFLQRHYGKKGPVFGGTLTGAAPAEERRKNAALIAPVLRGLLSSGQRMIGHFCDDESILEFVNSRDLGLLAPLGTSCPDHFLRTKIFPMVIDLDPNLTLEDAESVRNRLLPQIERYREQYREYYQAYRHTDSPPMRDPNPVILLYPGTGMFGFARDKPTARIATEFYLNAIRVMRGAEAVSSYCALPRQEAFDIEYWSLEEAKLNRMPKPRPLAGRIALVTGSGGGIGKAIAKKFAEQGACVLLSDNDEQRLAGADQEFRSQFGQDVFRSCRLDVTRSDSIRAACQEAAIHFGGMDILVNCAGISISQPIESHSEEDWDLLFDILVRGQFLSTQASVALLRKQQLGGDIINIVSKNALVSGPNNAGYGSAKAAQLHLSRLSAAELGKDHIRVNVVNPDAVIADSKIWAGAWAEGRAKAYGISVEDLPAYYARRTLLNEVILPEDIANACFIFVSGMMDKSTGNVLNVDGGIAAAFVR
jgi:rhamnulose-1-phosphate aldolase/alcohol dehydrogenase